MVKPDLTVDLEQGRVIFDQPPAKGTPITITHSKGPIPKGPGSTRCKPIGRFKVRRQLR